jgi:hypothetical protein
MRRIRGEIEIKRSAESSKKSLEFEAKTPINAGRLGTEARR